MHAPEIENLILLAVIPLVLLHVTTDSVHVPETVNSILDGPRFRSLHVTVEALTAVIRNVYTLV